MQEVRDRISSWGSECGHGTAGLTGSRIRSLHVKKFDREREKATGTLKKKKQNRG